MAKHRDIVTVEVLIDAAIDVVWKCWITPADIIKWTGFHCIKRRYSFSI